MDQKTLLKYHLFAVYIES